jgi:predicted CXXCH cytochrome family protein
MPRTPYTLLHARQWAGLCCIFLGITFGFFISAGGCSSPEQRYKTLSYFFDGVPDPDKRAVQSHATTTTGEGQVLLAAIVSTHKPYAEQKCDTCHRTATGAIQEFEEAYKLCNSCHKDVPNKLPRMHGPVAVGDCKWCHTAHESPQPHLLNNTPIKVCTGCHDTQLLGSKPPEHNDGKTSCLQCHFGHGGKDRHFLKPNATPQWPTSKPAGAP